MMTDLQQRRFSQRRTAINRATTYFKSGGRDQLRLAAVLLESSPDLTPVEVERLITACASVERANKEKT